MIDDVYKVVQVLLNKNGYGVITPDEFNGVCDMVQSKIYAGIPDEIRKINNRRNQGTSAITRGVLEQALYKLNVTEDLKRESVDSPFSFPATSKIESVYVNGREASLVAPEKLRMIATTRYTRPSATYPMYTIQDDGIDVLPGDDVLEIEVSYRKIPEKPRWTYVIIDNKAVFNPLDKKYKDFELSEHFFNRIVVDIALCFGIHLRENEVVQVMAREQDNNFQKENML